MRKLSSTYSPGWGLGRGKKVLPTGTSDYGLLHTLLSRTMAGTVSFTKDLEQP